MVKTYKSAVDLWLAAILIGVPVAIIMTGLSIASGLYFLHWHEAIGRVAGVLFTLTGLMTGVLIALFAFPCYYTLRETDLFIRAGLYKTVVRYRDIRRLELSCSLWNAPALSVNRVKIVLDEGFHLISPRNRTAFIIDLQARIDNASK